MSYTDADLALWLRNNPDLATINGGRADTPSVQPAPAKESPLEAKFMALWQRLGGAKLEREYTFHHSRKWRFDFADPETRIAVEVEGGTRSGGRHNRHEGFREDCTKYNAAVEDGWRVFRLTGDMIDTPTVAGLIRIVSDLKKEWRETK